MKTKRTILLIIIGLTVVFIWSNSFKSSGESMESSNSIKQMIIDFFNYFGIDIKNSFFVAFIRKFGHLSEYLVLGAELFLYRNCFLIKSKNTLLNITYIGVFIAFLDETIQLIPQNARSAEIRDVWIDMLGILLGFVIVKIVLLIINKIKNGRKSLQ